MKYRGYLIVLVLLMMVAMVSGEFNGGSGPGFGGEATSGGYYGYSGGYSGNWQYYQPSFWRLYAGQVDTYWPILNRIRDDQCNATSDFIIGIPPGGCTPGVVRSDLLADQSVPVFCELYAIKVNPLIKVSSIRSISFRGDYPKGVSGISFHPARAAVRSYDTLLGDPLVNDIGYVVIILKQNRVEENLEEWVAGNLTATIYYDADEAYGTGRAEYYLPVMSDDDWETDYARNAFWSGRGYLRLESVDGDRARVQLLTSKDKVVRTFSLREGETSGVSYLPGYYCWAGLKVRLNKIVAPEDSALLNIDGEQIWVRDGAKFLNGGCRIVKLDVDKNRVGNVTVKCTGNSKVILGLSERKEGEDLEDERWDGGVDDYFLKANDSVRELVEVYGSEVKETGEAFGEEALWEQIILAESLNKSKTQAELMDVFIDKYPSSKIVEQVRYRRQLLNGTDFGASSTSVYVNNKFHTISVVDFKDVNESNRRVSLRIGTKDETFGKGKEFDLGEKRRLVVKDIVPGKARVAFESKKKGVKSRTVWIEESQQDSFDGVDVYVRDIEVNEVAHLELIPEEDYTRTEADFSFRIGIEKRGVELSPTKTKEKLKNLNASIEKWEGIVERLGSVVKGMKGACFATSTVLMLKNAVSGFDGAAVARQKVMARYKAVCDMSYSTMSRTACYNNLSAQIENDVDAMTLALNKVNDNMDTAQGDNVGDGGLFGGKHVVDQEKYLAALREQAGGGSVSVDVGGGKIVEVPISEIDSVSQLRAVMLYRETGGQGVTGEAAKAEMDLALRNTALLVDGDKEKFALERVFVFGDVSFPVSVLSKGQGAFRDGRMRVSKNKLSSIVDGDLGLNNVKGDDSVGAQIVHVGLDNYLYVFDGKGAQLGVYEANKVDGKLEIGEKIGALPKVSGVSVEMVQTGSCSNSWPQGKAAVSYYEAGNNKGLPAIVPFDLENGWYVMVPNSGGTFLDSSPQGYTASADVRNFRICNIGSDRLMQSGQGDDLCQTFSVDSVGSVDDFIPCPKLTPDEVKRLYNRGREAIRQASNQHGKKVIRILDQMMELGNPMSQVGGFECQDFMSPDDCKLMFNVCDPVICPPSRCDLGGKMPVSDVIQTGIIGSLVLCLPNAADGVIAPICLSGVHAGLDNYLSILRSHKDCLERNLENGEFVGICDEITSIYKCEFFWRQLSPVLNQLVPSVVSSILAPGQRVRGGGEYALVEQSWNTMQQSISYFRDVYAQNAFRAFQLKNSEEAGSEICRAFIGTSVPASADMLDSLLEPESPPQFYAQFSEMLFSEATVPSTSQYKVYYHIYAGNDKGAQYRVYLKDPPATSYYASNPSVWVDSGYIAKGASADESVDFTAPSGYKQLCVVIDAKEECGFKQVTTDFGLNYVKDKYVQEQVEKSDITTESECISGSPSALSMVNLNVQSGAEEVVNPDIALRGIVRVCATTNPGLSVEGSREGGAGSRWKDVGYCGDSKMTCWLDSDSVKDDLERVEAVENTSLAVLDERRGLIENTKLTLEEVRKVLASARGRIKGLNKTALNNPGSGKVNKTLGELARIVSIDGDALAGTNADRAEALALRATIYRMIVEVKKRDAKVIVKPAPVGREEDECEVDKDCGADSGYEAFCDDNGVCRSRAVGGGEEEVEEKVVLLENISEEDILLKDGVEYRVRAKSDSGNGDVIFTLDRVDGGGLGERIEGLVSDELGDYGYTFGETSDGDGSVGNSDILLGDVRDGDKLVKGDVEYVVSGDPIVDGREVMFSLVRVDGVEPGEEVFGFFSDTLGDYGYTLVDSLDFLGACDITKKSEDEEVLICVDGVLDETSSSYEDSEIDKYKMKENCCGEKIGKNLGGEIRISKWPEPDSLTYGFLDCGDLRVKNMEKAMEFIEENVPAIDFKRVQVVDPEDMEKYNYGRSTKIIISCERNLVNVGQTSTMTARDKSGKWINLNSNIRFSPDLSTNGIPEVHELLHSLGFGDIKDDGGKESIMYFGANPFARVDTVYVGEDIIKELNDLYSSDVGKGEVEESGVVEEHTVPVYVVERGSGEDVSFVYSDEWFVYLANSWLSVSDVEDEDVVGLPSETKQAIADLRSVDEDIGVEKIGEMGDVEMNEVDVDDIKFFYDMDAELDFGDGEIAGEITSSPALSHLEEFGWDEDNPFYLRGDDIYYRGDFSGMRLDKYWFGDGYLVERDNWAGSDIGKIENGVISNKGFMSASAKIQGIFDELRDGYKFENLKFVRK